MQFLKQIRINLQLFADGAAAGDGGADGSATGDNSVAAGQRSLEDLGVPKEKAERYRKSKERQAKIQTTTDEVGNQTEPATEPAAVTAKASWDDILKDPEYNAKMQETVQARLASFTKKHGDAQKKLDAWSSAKDILAQRYGFEADENGNIDEDALIKAIVDDSSNYEDIANELGTDLKTAQEVYQLRRKEKLRETQEQQNLQDQFIRDHIADLERQGEELKKVIPEFDFAAEMRNPQFARMTSPSGGLSVEDAFYAIHHREIEQAKVSAAARNAATAISNSIRSGRNLPAENGTVTRTAAPAAEKPYSRMSEEEKAMYRASHGIPEPRRRK